MRPKKPVTRGSRHPKIRIDHDLPLKVALAFFFLGAAVIILTISLVALIVSVKARFEGLTASINGLTMKDEFTREYDKLIISRLKLEKDFLNQLAILDTKETIGDGKLELLRNLLSILKKFQADLYQLKSNVSRDYQSDKSFDPFKENCNKLRNKMMKIQADTASLKNRINKLKKPLEEADMKLANSSFLKEGFPKNFRYYQLGGYPSPRSLWSFLNWSPEMSLNRTFIRISDDVTQFGQSHAGQSLVESAFDLQFITDQINSFGFFLKLAPNLTGNVNLKPDFSQLDELGPKSRRITIWKLQN